MSVISLAACVQQDAWYGSCLHTWQVQTVQLWLGSNTSTTAAAPASVRAMTEVAALPQYPALVLAPVPGQVLQHTPACLAGLDTDVLHASQLFCHLL
jgi:hypothetical protein